jgi:hypothetical protein
MSKLPKFTAVMVLFLYLIGCGGGGGGGDKGVTYTGKTTPAVIDDTNANILAESAISGSSTGSSFVIARGQEAQPAPTILDVARILSNSLTQINILLPSSDVAARIVNITDDLPCSGGGRIRVNMDIDDITLDFTGNFNFFGCVEGDTTMNGSTGVNGTFTGSGFSLLNFNFNPMTVDSGTESYTMSGTVQTSFSGSTATITMNVRSRNNNTQMVEWINNVTITATDFGSFVEMTITGRFYHPEHGYIDIVTTDPLGINNFDQFPSSGQIIITGDSGSKARLTATSNTQYTLEVDADGAGGYETITTENWG